MIKPICILEKDDLKIFNDLTTQVFIKNTFRMFNDDDIILRKKLQTVWKDLGYRYNFQVRDVVITTDGKVYVAKDYEIIKAC